MNFWNFSVNQESEKVTLRIDGDIVADTDTWYYEWFDDPHTAPSAFRQELRQYDGRDLEVIISTFGGDVFAGLSIAGDIRARRGKTIGIVHSHCMSIGMSILSACDEVRAMPGAMFMIHSPLTAIQGGIKEFEQTLEVLNTIKDSIISGYQTRVDLTAEQLSEMMLAETWMDVNTALRYGFIDSVIDDGRTVTNSAKISRINIMNSVDKSMERFKNFIAKRNESENQKTTELDELALFADWQECFFNTRK